MVFIIFCIRYTYYIAISVFVVVIFSFLKLLCLYRFKILFSLLSLWSYFPIFCLSFFLLSFEVSGDVRYSFLSIFMGLFVDCLLEWYCYWFFFASSTFSISFLYKIAKIFKRGGSGTSPLFCSRFWFNFFITLSWTQILQRCFWFEFFFKFLFQSCFSYSFFVEILFWAFVVAYSWRAHF